MKTRVDLPLSDKERRERASKIFTVTEACGGNDVLFMNAIQSQASIQQKSAMDYMTLGHYYEHLSLFYHKTNNPQRATRELANSACSSITGILIGNEALLNASATKMEENARAEAEARERDRLEAAAERERSRSILNI